MNSMKKITKTSKKTKSFSKKVLLYPYKNSWPIIDEKSSLEIFQNLKNIIEPLKIKFDNSKLIKIKRKNIEAEKPSIIKKVCLITNDDGSHVSEKIDKYECDIFKEEDKCEIFHKIDKSKEVCNVNKTENSDGCNLDKDKNNVIYKKELQNQRECRKKLLSIGINCVTKGLERDQLKLIIVDRSANLMITKHLINLSTSKNCPSACLYDFSDVIKDILGMPCVALGFNRVCDLMNSEVEHLASVISRITTSIEGNSMTILGDENKEFSIFQIKKVKYGQDEMIVDDSPTEFDMAVESDKCSEESTQNSKSTLSQNPEIFLDYNSLDYKDFYVQKSESEYIFNDFFTHDHIRCTNDISDRSLKMLNFSLEKYKSNIVENINSGLPMENDYIPTAIGLLSPNPNRTKKMTI